MKVIDVQRAAPSLEEVMNLADSELVVLRQTNGKVFAVSQVDEFDWEVELLKTNPEFMAFMEKLSQEKATISSRQLREELGL